MAWKVIQDKVPLQQKVDSTSIKFEISWQQSNLTSKKARYSRIYDAFISGWKSCLEKQYEKIPHPVRACKIANDQIFYITTRFRGLS